MLKENCLKSQHKATGTHDKISNDKFQSVGQRETFGALMLTELICLWVWLTAIIQLLLKQTLRLLLQNCTL